MTQMEMYVQNQKEIAQEHYGEIIAVHNGQYMGSFKSKLAAYRAMIQKGYKEGEFIITTSNYENPIYICM